MSHQKKWNTQIRNVIITTEKCNRRKVSNSVLLLSRRTCEIGLSSDHTWSQVNDIRRCAAHCTALHMSCCTLTCHNNTVRVEHCFWMLLPDRCADYYNWWLCYVVACDELTVWWDVCVTSWLVTSWPCDDVTMWGNYLVTSWLVTVWSKSQIPSR